MDNIKFETLKDSPNIINEIRWDITPAMFIDPRAVDKDNPADITYGYMLYVDHVNDKPALVIMQLRAIICKTVGYIYDIPEKFFQGVLDTQSAETNSGMYTLTEDFKAWLKSELISP
ncbi:MAG: hypothetical protein ISR96_04540 [Nitrospira sp.]|nr:hypothetical protein [bacterium]MBL7048773.1 hypothetical protein [Nitrospira sp.]